MAIPTEPVHINAKKGEIAKVVLMPGDPLRAKYIAEKFLTDVKEVTHVRNMLGFTGYYKGTQVTVMGSGMGMPSMSIYAFELYHFYGVEKIIRIGTCGALNPSADVGEIILADKIYSESNFAYQYNGYLLDIVDPSQELNTKIKEVATKKKLNLHTGMLMTCDVFGPYVDLDAIMNRMPKDIHPLGEEMEAFGLVHVANSLGKKATAMATVVNSRFSTKIISIEDRERALNDMISLALDSLV